MPDPLPSWAGQSSIGSANLEVDVTAVTMPQRIAGASRSLTAANHQHTERRRHSLGDAQSRPFLTSPIGSWTARTSMAVAEFPTTMDGTSATTLIDGQRAAREIAAPYRALPTRRARRSPK